MNSIPIFTLPEKVTLDQLDYIPVSSDLQTSKVTPSNFRKNMDKTASLPVTSSVASDDYIKVDSTTYGTRALRVRSSVLYDAMVGITASFNQVVLGSDIRLSNARVPLPHSHSIQNMTDFNPVDYVLSSKVGATNGVAPLDTSSLVPSIYLPPYPIIEVPSASAINSNATNLVSNTSVQGAIDQLSNASYIYINATNAGVTGTTNVQGALAQKLSLSGGNITGLLTVSANNFRVGSNDIYTDDNKVGIGTSTPSTKLHVAGSLTTSGDYIYIKSNSFPQLVLQDSNTNGKRFGIWRDPADILAIGPQDVFGGGTAALVIRRNTSAEFASSLTCRGLDVKRSDTINEGGQINLCRSSDGANAWSIDVFGSTNTPTIRFINEGGTSQHRVPFQVGSDGNITITGTMYGTASFANTVNQMEWKHYGTGHTIFDASIGTSPSGTSVNNTNATVAWTSTYPTLMGWNGSQTYGVRVDSARLADLVADNSVTPTKLSTGHPSWGDSGNLSVAGKITSTSTVGGDSGTTVVTKDYVDSRDVYLTEASFTGGVDDDIIIFFNGIRVAGSTIRTSGARSRRLTWNSSESLYWSYVSDTSNGTSYSDDGPRRMIPKVMKSSYAVTFLNYERGSGKRVDAGSVYRLTFSDGTVYTHTKTTTDTNAYYHVFFVTGRSTPHTESTFVYASNRDDLTYIL